MVSSPIRLDACGRRRPQAEIEDLSDRLEGYAVLNKQAVAGESHPRFLSDLQVAVSRDAVDDYTCSASSLAGTLMGTPS